jgi:excisionase family DNA binding protein
MPKLMTLREAAEVLRLGKRTLARLLAERRITSVHLGHRVFVPEAAIAAYIQANTMPELPDSRVG